MDWLGRKWEAVNKELAEQGVEFVSEITYPAGKAIACGDLRVVRISQAEGKLKFILLRDRFYKS